MRLHLGTLARRVLIALTSTLIVLGVAPVGVAWARTDPGRSGSVDSAAARAVTWSAERRISRGEDYYLIRDLSEAQGQNGVLHVIWREAKQIFYRQLDKFGNTVVDTVRLPATVYGHSSVSYATVAAMPDGGAVVLWYAATGDGVYGLRLDAAGRVLVAPTYLSTKTIKFLDAAVQSDGTIHVVGRVDCRPVYARYTADFHVLTPWMSLVQIDRARLTRTPRVVLTSGGAAQVVWWDRRDPPILNSQLRVSRLAFGANGGLLPPGDGSVDQELFASRTGGFMVSDGNQSSLDDGTNAPSVDLAASGDEHVALTSGSRLYYKRQNAALSLPTAAVNVTGPLACQSTAIRARSSGGADIVFSLSAHTNSGRPALVTVSSSGKVLSGPTAIATATKRVIEVYLERTSGQLRLVYQGADSKHRIYYLDTIRNAAAFDQQRCDLVVDDAHSSDDPDMPREGGQVTMTVRVGNAGWVASPASVARFSFAGQPIADVPVPALPVDGTALVSATWTVPGPVVTDTLNVTVSLDPAGSIKETSETNNTVIHVLPVFKRPTGASVNIRVYDETNDPDHASDWQEPVDTFTATIIGTSTEPPGPYSVTVNGAGGGARFPNVPPGTYTVSVQSTGWAGTQTAGVTVQRDAVDPYVMHITPSTPPVLWLNRWCTLDGTVTHEGQPLLGVKVRPLGLDWFDTTDSSGQYSLQRIPAGDYRFAFTKDGYGRVITGPVTLTVGTPGVLNMTMDHTGDCYIDCTVTDGDGYPLAGATVTLHNAAHAAIGGPVEADGYGRCSFVVPGGVSYHLNGTLEGYIGGDGSSFSTTAGHEYERTLVLPLDVSAVETRQSATRTYVCNNDPGYTYRCFKTSLRLERQKRGTKWYALSLTPWVEGVFFEAAPDNHPHGGPYEVGSFDWDPDPNNMANVAMSGLELTTATRLARGQDPIWEWKPPNSPWYSHQLESESNAVRYPMNKEIVWDDVRVLMLVHVGKAVPGSEGAAGFTNPPIGVWVDGDKAVIVWTPSSNDMRVEPYGFSGSWGL